jgi:hypothetical protein
VRAITILVALMLSVGTARAANTGGRLPVFAVTAADGRVTTSAAMARDGRWVLIYIPVECGGCGSLLRLVDKDEHPELPAQIAIIVAGGTSDGVRGAAAQFPSLLDAAWFADPTAASAAALRLGGAPAVIGMDGDSIEWTVTGVLGGSPEVKSILERWLAR